MQSTQEAAYFLWQQRGCPWGSPDVDWFSAEQQVGLTENEAESKPAIVAVAEVLGSALGSVAGLAASVGSFIHSDDHPA